MKDTTVVNGIIFKVGDFYKVKAFNINLPTEVFLGKLLSYNPVVDTLLFRVLDRETTNSPPITYYVKSEDIIQAAHIPEGTQIVPFDNDSTKEPHNGESDPTGLAASDPGAKLDSGKIFANDILSQFPRALEAVIQVGTFGANKYSLGGWISVDDGVRRYKNAAGRHKLYRDKGEHIDPDSGFPHEYHELWNHMAALELKLRQDD